jgi:hypothetical protein
MLQKGFTLRQHGKQMAYFESSPCHTVWYCGHSSKSKRNTSVSILLRKTNQFFVSYQEKNFTSMVWLQLFVREVLDISTFMDHTVKYSMQHEKYFIFLLFHGF